MEARDIFESQPIFQRFLEAADYPEIISVCIANPPVCEAGWVKDIIREKHRDFYDFLFFLDRAELKRYCLSRSDVCRIKTVRDIIESVDAENFFAQPAVKENALTVKDLRNMEDGMEITIVERTHTVFRLVRSAILGGRLDPNTLETAEDFVKKLHLTEKMKIIDKSGGLVSFHTDGVWSDPRYVGYRWDRFLYPNAIDQDTPPDHQIGVFPIVPISALSEFPKVKVSGGL